MLRGDLIPEDAKTEWTKLETTGNQEIIQKKPLFERLWFLILTAIPFIGFGILCVIRGALFFVETINDTTWLAEAFKWFAITFAVLYILFGIYYIVFGVLFAIPSKMGKAGLGWCVALIILPTLFNVVNLIEQILDGMDAGNPIYLSSFPSELSWIVFAVIGSTILIARWKTLKD